VLVQLSHSVLPISAATLGWAAQVHAQSATWTGAGDGTSWTDPNNWDTLPPNTSPGDDLTFAGGTVGTIQLQGNELANSTTFNAGFTLDSPLSTDSLTISTGTVSVGSSVSSTVNAIIAGSNGFNFAGPGTLTISGSNSYTGGTNINGGTLIAAGPSSLATVSISVGAGANLMLAANTTLGGVITQNGNLTVENNVTATVANASDTFNQNSGTLAVNGTLAVGGASFRYSGGTINGTVNLGNGSRLYLDAGAGNSGSFDFSGYVENLGEDKYPYSTAIPSGVTITVQAISGGSDLLGLVSQTTNAGTLNIISNGTWTAELYADPALSFTNAGLITTSTTGSPSSATDFLDITLLNTGTVNVNAPTELDDTCINYNGAFNIAGGQTLSCNSGGSFSQNGGTLAINGTLAMINTPFYDEGGTISGTVIFEGGLSKSVLSFGAGAGNSGTFLFQSSWGYLTGTIPSGATVIFQPTSFTSGTIEMTNVTNDGNINIIGSGTSTATLTTGGGTLTNTGTLTMSAANSPTSVTYFISGHLYNSTGTVNIDASTHTTSSITNGGIFNIASGQTLSFNFPGSLQNTGVINVAGAGVFDISNGQLNLSGGTMSLAAGPPGAPAELKLGSFTFSGTSATATIASGIVGSGQTPGFVDLGGKVEMFSIGSGIAPQQVVISAPITDGGISKSGAGALELSWANTYTLGTSVSAGNLLVGANGALSNGPVNITGGVLQLETNTGLAQMTSMTITGNGVLDVNNNHVIITYGSSDPITTIAGYIASGYNGGRWNGPGIISSAAEVSTNGLLYGVGYADGADGVVAGLTSGQIEVKYTLLGDANLDGLVNGADFNILAANFNQSITGWDQGDFNYDGVVNSADFNELAANFNQGVSGAASAGDIAALDTFAVANGLSLPTSSVPEPGSASILVMASIGFLAARRARRRTTE
jgi:autotransporter-associated beta strand protein